MASGSIEYRGPFVQECAGISKSENTERPLADFLGELAILQLKADNRMQASSVETNVNYMQSNLDHFQQALRVAPAALLSVVLHLLLLIVLALLILSDKTVEPLVLQVAADDGQDDDSAFQWETLSFDAEPVVRDSSLSVEEIAVVDADLAISEIGDVAMPALPDQSNDAQSGKGSEAAEFPKGLSDEFVKKIRDARKHGIDIVIVFDSTGSMGSEIETVKSRIGAIGEVILRQIPRAQFSLVTYRDRRDAYLVRGIPLTNDLYKVQRFVTGVQAQGGGDHPEALEAGMEWAMTTLYFRPDRQKVMLIFGDAPPHQHHMNACLKMARRFRESGKGKVSTITCRSAIPMREFYAIARSGGGEAYTLRNTRWLMEELLVLAFGREHRDDVLEFFELEPNQD
jgi:Mg-chelatase subunit ChlD